MADEDSDYIRTPGIDVSQQLVSDAGEFVIWDCAGQKEYSITHGMFLGAISQSIFLVLYDLAVQESKQVTEYFLRIILICIIKRIRTSEEIYIQESNLVPLVPTIR